MPRGDRYKLKKWTKGPKNDIAKRNAHVDALQDALDRVCDLEGDGGAGTQPFNVCRNGAPAITYIPAGAIVPVA